MICVDAGGDRHRGRHPGQGVEQMPFPAQAGHA
jgi:hypothetical protein